MSGIDYSPDGGTSLTFNFDNTNLDQPPAEYMDLAITNLFYTNNMMHDIWYRYGFDEISGNFGHKTEIETKTTKTGKVSIFYHSPDELETIIQKLLKL